MKVYIVVTGYDWEGEDIHSVYNNRSAAENILAILEADKWGADYRRIYEHEVLDNPTLDSQASPRTI